MSRCPALVLVLVAVAAGAPSRARASVEPLVVVVETRAGAAVDPVEVRRVIAAELRAPVRAPRDQEADETSDLMIVAVDRAEIRMSLRAHAASVVSRLVPAPGDPKARLQWIGWLAGNLARDQVSAVVAAAPVPAAVSPAPTEGELPPRAQVPPPITPTTEPPPLADSPARERIPAADNVVAARSAPAALSRPTWSLTIGGGPSALWAGTGDRIQPLWPGPGIWYLEVQRRLSAGPLIVGAALDVGPDMALGGRSPSLNFIGGSALVGAGHRFGRTFVEATAGLGLEVYQSVATVQTTTTSATGIQPQTQAIPIVVVGLYLRGQATVGFALSRSLDLLASAGGHLGSVSKWDHFVTTSLGLRVRFN
jgi:hypothetical protein